MATNTSRLSLTKPDSLEFVNVGILNANWDKVDANVGMLWVADGARPAGADTFRGMLIKELTSGKVFIAKENGVGGWNWFTETSYVGFTCGMTPATGVETIVSGITLAAGPTMFPPDYSIVGGAKITLTRPGIYISYIRLQVSTVYGSGTRTFLTSRENGTETARCAYNGEYLVQMSSPVNVTSGGSVDLEWTAFCANAQNFSGAIRILKVG